MGESVNKAGYCCGVVRSAYVKGDMMVALKLLCWGFCFEWGLVNLHTLVNWAGVVWIDVDFVKYRATFQN